MFKVESFKTRAIVSGALTTTEVFFVATAEGQPVTGKQHKTLEAAEVELGSMAHLSEGMAFAAAKFPELSDKAQKGKANVVAEYLAWLEAGKPVTVNEAPVVEEATESEAPVVTEEEDETEF